MESVLKYVSRNFSFLVLSGFFLIALLNPLFKKYDYGAEFPLVIVFGVLLLVIGVAEWRKKREAANLEQIFLSLFTLLVVISFIFSQTKNYGFSEVLAFLSVSSLYLIIAYTKIPWIKIFLKIVAVGALLSVLLGFILYFWWPEVRMIGPFFNILYHAHVWPNAFALFLIMTWPVFLWFAFAKKKYSKIFMVLSFSLLFSALYLTFSRGALLTFAGQLVLALIFFYKKIDLKIIFTAILIAALSFGIFSGANYLRALNHEIIDVEERVSFDNSEGLTSKQERIDFWIGAYELTKQEPLTGWGPYSFRYAYNGIQKTFLGSSDHPHNIFLKISAEYGVPAVVCFIAFLFMSFMTLISRFKKLNNEKKNLVFVLLISVLGAFAHNLIDYNFNFLVNLMTLFLFLAFIRSLLVKDVKTKSSPVVGFGLPLIIALISFYEGGLLVLAYTVDESYLEYSNFPRNYYLEVAEKSIKSNDFDTALWYLDEQIYKNSLDSQAYYLRGVIYCDKDDSKKCAENMTKAVTLNPMNDFNYYIGYLKSGAQAEAEAGIPDPLPLLEQYFDYVENNVHFTAYTSNVEAAAELLELILSPTHAIDYSYYWEKKEQMLKTAEKLRTNKNF